MAPLEREVVGSKVIGEVVYSDQIELTAVVRWYDEGEGATEREMDWGTLKNVIDRHDDRILKNNRVILEIVEGWVCIDCGTEAFYDRSAKGFYCPVCDY